MKVAIPLLLLILGGCAAAPQALAPDRGPLAPQALTEREVASIKAIKKEITKFFEVATLDRLALVKTVAIAPASLWNEFQFEAEIEEEDLDAGLSRLRFTGIYDAVGKQVEVKTRELLEFRPHR
jgi:hypothetical protein